MLRKVVVQCIVVAFFLIFFGVDFFYDEDQLTFFFYSVSSEKNLKVIRFYWTTEPFRM